MKTLELTQAEMLDDLVAQHQRYLVGATGSDLKTAFYVYKREHHQPQIVLFARPGGAYRREIYLQDAEGGIFKPVPPIVLDGPLIRRHLTLLDQRFLMNFRNQEKIDEQI